MKERNLSIDYLKFVALLCLLIAHISTNFILLQIRNFDVNLLVILSAMLASDSVVRHSGNTLSYIRKRFVRLVIPTWIFITFYLLVNSYFHFQTLNLNNIIRSYLLQDNSIGYVWIIYVYFVCGVMMPWLVKIDLSKTKVRVGLVIVAFIYVLLYLLSLDV